jgi:hypothetical protein
VSDYTPSTDAVRWAYFCKRADIGEDAPTSQDIDAEFDRWLAECDRRVRAEAWDEGAEACDWGFSKGAPRNPYEDDDE